MLNGKKQEDSLGKEEQDGWTKHGNVWRKKSILRKKEDHIWRKFIRKNLLYYIIPNTFFNACIPYFSFKDLNAVHLFQGEQCIARFLLPMALFLPFIITFDILKKSIILSEQGKIGHVLPENFKKNKFIFTMAGINGTVTLFIMFLTMIALHFNLPENYSFNGTVFSVFLGLLAGTLSVIFTLWPVKKLRRLFFTLSAPAI